MSEDQSTWNELKDIFGLTAGDIRHSAKPVARQLLYDHYEKQAASYWTVKSVDFSKDRTKFLTLPIEQQEMITKLHVLFTKADRLADKIYSVKVAPLKEVMYDYNLVANFQTAIENIHEIGYDKATETIIGGDKEKLDHVRKDFDKYPLIANLYNWVDRHTNLTAGDYANQIPKVILVMALYEGVLFAGSFSIILNYDDILLGICDLNKYIARDEGFHHVTWFILYSYLASTYLLLEEEAHEIVEEFVDCILPFFEEIIPDNIETIYYENVKLYIEYMADYTLVSMGYNKLYHSKNPFDYMEKYAHDVVANPHERKSQSYTMPVNAVKIDDPSTLGKSYKSNDDADIFGEN